MTSRINGNGYFAVQTPPGMRYTRDGHFTLDANGQIVTERRLCRCRAMAAPSPSRPTTRMSRSASDGTISSTVNGIGNQIGKLQVVGFRR